MPWPACICLLGMHYFQTFPLFVTSHPVPPLSSAPTPVFTMGDVCICETNLIRDALALKLLMEQ